MTRSYGGEYICADCFDRAIDGEAVEKARQIVLNYEPEERLSTSRCESCMAFRPDLAMAEDADGARICPQCATAKLKNQKEIIACKE